MECPKCHSIISDNATFCPHCHKVFYLECPNCHTHSENAVCEKCGYTILVKCAKCNKMNLATSATCSKCNFPVDISLGQQECETDEFASIAISFNSLPQIKKILKSQELYAKFLYNLKNILNPVLKKFDGTIIKYEETYVLNFNKELSFTTSALKAVKMSIKIANLFVPLNQKILQELYKNLGLKITITKKTAQNLQKKEIFDNKIKLLTINKKKAKYLQGLQIALDQYVNDAVNKEFQTDSLYCYENNGQSLNFYELMPDSYIIPPEKNPEKDDLQNITTQISSNKKKKQKKDLYSFHVFDIKSKCKFVTSDELELIKNLSSDEFGKSKIISIRALEDMNINTPDIINALKQKSPDILTVQCTEKMTYKPWGFFNTLFKEFYKFTINNTLNKEIVIDPKELNNFKPLFELVMGQATKASTPEDARYTYMNYYSKFLSRLKNTYIVIEDFEYLDDNSLQTLEVYFDRFRNIAPNFVFITSKDKHLHSDIKALLQTSLYTEISIKPANIENALLSLNTDTSDFIQSFYFEKILENWDGNYLYFQNAIKYLEETSVLINFENRLIVKDNKSVILAKNINDLYKSRIKLMGNLPDVSLILSYLGILGEKLDFKTLELLRIQELDNSVEYLKTSGLCEVTDNFIRLNNYNLVAPVILSLIKPETKELLAKNCLAQIGQNINNTILSNLFELVNLFKEKYVTCLQTSELAIKSGDFDAYYKNCCVFLSLLDKIGTNIPEKLVTEHKKEVYNNILLWLYSYSPSKIYYIENLLLMDAIKEKDDEKIVKLSNLMLQGALISSNYTDALKLLHNILIRMKNATFIIDGEINKKFFLLSLIHIEILYNIGRFKECIEIQEQMLDILNEQNIESVCPECFSANSFIAHLIDTFRLGILAKIYLLDNDTENFISKIEQILKIDYPEKESLLAITEYLETKNCSVKNLESASAYSKVIYLILQEFCNLKDDYKNFAQNIYQAKLLAAEIHQKEPELLCDLLIAYAYKKAGVQEKAKAIYADILNYAQKNALYNVMLLSKYFCAELELQNNNKDEAFSLINNSLGLMQKYNNSPKFLYVLFEKLYMKFLTDEKDIINEQSKLDPFKTKLAIFLEE